MLLWKNQNIFVLTFPAHKEGASEVKVHHGGPSLLAQICWRSGKLPTAVVHHEIQLPIPRYGVRYQIGYLCRLSIIIWVKLQLESCNIDTASIYYYHMDLTLDSGIEPSSVILCQTIRKYITDMAHETYNQIIRKWYEGVINKHWRNGMKPKHLRNNEFNNFF